MLVRMIFLGCFEVYLQVIYKKIGLCSESEIQMWQYVHLRKKNHSGSQRDKEKPNYRRRVTFSCCPRSIGRCDPTVCRWRATARSWPMALQNRMSETPQAWDFLSRSAPAQSSASSQPGGTHYRSGTRNSRLLTTEHQPPSLSLARSPI